MNDIGALVAGEVECAAEWRLQKADEFPDDADRNLQAATRLYRIAGDLNQLEGSQLHWRLQGLCARSCERYCEILQQLIRAVGFGCSAKTGAEFLDYLCFLL